MHSKISPSGTIVGSPPSSETANGPRPSFVIVHSSASKIATFPALRVDVMIPSSFGVNSASTVPSNTLIVVL